MKCCIICIYFSHALKQVQFDNISVFNSFVLSALFLGGLVNFSILLFIIISANSDMSHLGNVDLYYEHRLSLKISKMANFILHHDSKWL